MDPPSCEGVLIRKVVKIADSSTDLFLHFPDLISRQLQVDVVVQLLISLPDRLPLGFGEEFELWYLASLGQGILVGWVLWKLEMGGERGILVFWDLCFRTIDVEVAQVSDDAMKRSSVAERVGDVDTQDVVLGWEQGGQSHGEHGGVRIRFGRQWITQSADVVFTFLANDFIPWEGTSCLDGVGFERDRGVGQFDLHKNGQSTDLDGEEI